METHENYKENSQEDISLNKQAYRELSNHQIKLAENTDNISNHSIPSDKKTTIISKHDHKSNRNKKISNTKESIIVMDNPIPKKSLDNINNPY